MIAYKFLARGGVAPFTKFRWPSPDGGEAAWVSAPSLADEERWIHACRPAHLPYWLREELWELELAEPVREERYQVAAPRGRLRSRVAGWDAAAADAFAHACAWRARELLLAHLAEQPEMAALLSRAGDLASVATAAAAIAPREPLAGYVALAARRALGGHHAFAALNHAALGAALAAPSASAGFEAERAWQARWLSDRLALS